MYIWEDCAIREGDKLTFDINYASHRWFAFSEFLVSIRRIDPIANLMFLSITPSIALQSLVVMERFKAIIELLHIVHIVHGLLSMALSQENLRSRKLKCARRKWTNSLKDITSSVRLC